MNETLPSKLARLLMENAIYRVQINIKCKTRDGMIYTLMSNEYDRAEFEAVSCLPFSDSVHSATVQNLLEMTDIIKKGDGYWFSVEEMVSIKHTEIIRVWAELGNLYHNDFPVEK